METIIIGVLLTAVIALGVLLAVVTCPGTSKSEDLEEELSVELPPNPTELDRLALLGSLLSQVREGAFPEITTDENGQLLGYTLIKEVTLTRTGDLRTAHLLLHIALALVDRMPGTYPILQDKIRAASIQSAKDIYELR